MSTRFSFPKSSHAPSPQAVPVVIYDEPMVEFFPRNAAPGARYFWRNQAEADSVAKQKAEMLARAHREVLSAVSR
jgi:hypothetical protein